MSRQRKNSDGTPHIPRPPNIFIVFRKEWAKANKALTLGMKLPQISKAAGAAWRRLAPEQRAYWAIEEEKAKVDHALKHPDYKFKPKFNKRVEGAEKKVKKGSKGGGKGQEPPRKRRRMGEPLTNVAPERHGYGEQEDIAASSFETQEVDWYASAGPSSSSVPANVSEAPSFAENYQTFNFRMPYVPAGPPPQAAYQANTTIENNPNVFRIREDYQWPTADVQFAHGPGATGFNNMYFQSYAGYPVAATDVNEDAYPGVGYVWPAVDEGEYQDNYPTHYAGAGFSFDDQAARAAIAEAMYAYYRAQAP